MLTALIFSLAAAQALASFHVKLRDTDFCVDVPNGQTNYQLQLWSCVEGNTNQAWQLNAFSRAPGNPTTLSFGSSGWCIGISPGNVGDNAPVGLVPCENSCTWRNSPHSLCLWDNPDYCIGCSGDPGNGTPLVLRKNKSNAQNWYLLDPA